MVLHFRLVWRTLLSLHFPVNVCLQLVQILISGFLVCLYSVLLVKVPLYLKRQIIKRTSMKEGVLTSNINENINDIWHPRKLLNFRIANSCNVIRMWLWMYLLHFTLVHSKDCMGVPLSQDTTYWQKRLLQKWLLEYAIFVNFWSNRIL